MRTRPRRGGADRYSIPQMRGPSSPWVVVVSVSPSSQRTVTVRARAADGAVKEFRAAVRIDTPQEVLYYRHGGILRFVLRQLLGAA